MLELMISTISVGPAAAIVSGGSRIPPAVLVSMPLKLLVRLTLAGLGPSGPRSGRWFEGPPAVSGLRTGPPGCAACADECTRSGRLRLVGRSPLIMAEMSRAAAALFLALSANAAADRPA